ncbi:YlbL family protein [Janibacter corallicola]|uniref:YlbL family protein n=1 Tax=Janibacter corallicola TaxID=415212 RepID=UPI000B28430D|nr:PDZ domain-containing protein [Janibacter corallicola]
MTQPRTRRPRGEVIARRVLIAAILLTIVALAGTFIKVRYVIEEPGPVTNTIGGKGDPALITVKGAKTYPTKGELSFTTVRVRGGPDRHISAWEWLFAKADPDVRLLPEDEVFGDRTSKEVEQANEAMMQGSQHTAVAVGMRSTGLTVPSVTIAAQVAKGEPADGELEAGDEIVSVDGEDVDDAESVATAVADREPGDPVRIGYVRDGERSQVRLKTTDIGQGRAGVGIALQPKYDYPFKVRIDAGDVGGPSAGMMFALGVRDTLTPGPMTGGKSIAGTGTIDDDGSVGPIGGIQQKMIGAHDGGARWFLAPESNCDEVAGHVPDGLKVVSVSDFGDATDAVDAIADGHAKGLPTCDAP